MLYLYGKSADLYALLWLKRKMRLSFLLLHIALAVVHSIDTHGQKKAVFIILDGISADVIEQIETPFLDSIASEGGYTRAWLGGEKGGYSQSPTVSAVGYNHVLTGTWSNKHNVWDNDIKDPNYRYWNIFRIAKHVRPDIRTAIFSSWEDNRTKLVGENKSEAGAFNFDYSSDGFEHDNKTFPHTKDRKFIFNIDEHVSKEAAQYLEQEGPDLSWVYLEYPDDMGHMYGDGPQYFDAVRKADAQVGRIWRSIKRRKARMNEDWMIVVTTDHGRDAQTGKGHGGQSDRERTVWITTNANNLNKRFQQMPASVDIMPSILRFMEIPIPEEIEKEIDGIPFVGEVSVANLQAARKDKQIEIRWGVLDTRGTARVLVSTTNNFKDGREDKYTEMGRVPVSDGKFKFLISQASDLISQASDFYKILLVAPHNVTNTWVVPANREQ